MSVSGSSEPRLRRTLRGRVSLLGLAVIAAWVLTLTIGFNLVFAHRVSAETDAALRARAAAAAATVVAGPYGVRVRESGADQTLDSGIWVFAGRRAVDQPTRSARLTRAVTALLGQGRTFADGPDGYRLYSLPVPTVRDSVTVVVAVSTASADRARVAAAEGSVVVALLVLAGAYPVLRFAAGRALRPVDAMTERAGEWSAHGLRERFGPDQRFRELRTLAATLDGVLDRLAAVVRHERRLPAEISHELRTPLSRIVAETDLLLARSHTEEQLAEAHRSIHESAMGMTRILDTLLTAARVDADQPPGRCALHLAVEHVVNGHASRGVPEITIEVSDTVDVGVEAAVLERVLAPVLDNALRYARTRVDVTAIRTADSVLLAIRDDGPGVPAGKEELIFEPGYRAAAHDRHDGAGLGLALARRLARSCAGDVTVVPPSTFLVRLPPA